MIGRDSILSASQNILDLFDATTEEERILNNRMDEQLDEIANADSEEDEFRSELEADDVEEEKQGGVSVEIVLNNPENETTHAAPTIPPTPVPSEVPENYNSQNVSAAPTAVPAATAVSRPPSARMTIMPPSQKPQAARVAASRSRQSSVRRSRHLRQLRFSQGCLSSIFCRIIFAASLFLSLL